MTAPFLNLAELQARGFTIQSDTPSTVQQSMQNLLTERPVKRKIGHEIELEFHRIVEQWLRLNGYRPRTPDEIKRGGDCAGWYVHLHEARGNPIILDFLVFSADYSWVCEIELKSEKGQPTDEQAEIIKRGGHLCRTLDDVRDAILAAKSAIKKL